jgi:hypothetical protein
VRIAKEVRKMLIPFIYRIDKILEQDELITDHFDLITQLKEFQKPSVKMI